MDHSTTPTIRRKAGLGSSEKQDHSRCRVRFRTPDQRRLPPTLAEVARRSGAANPGGFGKCNPSFTVAGATAYGNDVSGTEIHILEVGHFVPDEATDQIASLVLNFFDRLKQTRRMVSGSDAEAGACLPVQEKSQITQIGGLSDPPRCRTSFAPETTSTKRNEHGRNRTKTQQNQRI